MKLITHDCSEELHDLGLRATPARVALLQLLERTVEPLDVQTMIGFLEKKSIKTDPATVFRIMNMFSEKGLVNVIQLQESKFRYELASLPDHHHFVCESCGAITDISDCNISVLEEEVMRKKGLLIKRHALEFYGICDTCLSKEK